MASVVVDAEPAPAGSASALEETSGGSSLLGAAQAWAKTPAKPASADASTKIDVLILGSDSDIEGATPTEDLRLLMAALERRSLKVSVWPDWCTLSPLLHTPGCLAGVAVLPLMVWDYCQSIGLHRAFCQLMSDLADIGARPAADLHGVQWCSDKRYLLELQSEGIPIVPTVHLPCGSTAGNLRDARTRLRERRADLVEASAAPFELSTSLGKRPRCSESPSPDGATPPPACYVAKPAVAGGGDGVERLRDGDARAEAALLRCLEMRDHMIQPFLPGVLAEGELCFVFVNGELLHAVRKDPEGWGQSATGAEGGCAGVGAGAGAAGEPTGVAAQQHACTHQPVILEESPPAAAEALARRALAFARRKCSAEGGAGFFLARVDLLPYRQEARRMPRAAAVGAPTSEGSGDGGGGDEAEGCGYLVSEIEIGWPHLFLRAQPGSADRVASKLIERRSSDETASQSPGGAEPAKVQGRYREGTGKVPSQSPGGAEPAKVAVDVDAMSVKEMKALIAAAGLSHSGITDKGELREQAREAAKQQAQGVPFEDRRAGRQA
jgi:hypothetical protein